MERSHGIAGGLVVRTVDSTAGLERSVMAAFGGGPAGVAAASSPFETGASAQSDPLVGRTLSGRITIRMHARPRSRTAAGPEPGTREITGDAGDGRIVGRIDGGLVVEDRHGSVEVRGSVDDLDLSVAGGTSAWAFIRDLARPALQVAGIGSGVVVVHGAAVAFDEAAWLIAGWSESGKTEVALALAESGATFVGDKWTVLFGPSHAGPNQAAEAPPGTTQAAPFPVRVGVRDWILTFLPTLAGAIGPGRRARLGGGAVAAAIATRAGRIAAGRPVTDAVLGPLAQSASLAATIRLDADVIRRAYGEAVLAPGSRPLGGVILLTTIGHGEPVTRAPLEPEIAAARMARSAAYERRGYHLLGERAAIHGAAPIPGFGIVGEEAAALHRLIRAVPVIEVRAPFPADPRIAARLIREVL